jgi:hypothetical protein
MRRAFLLWRGRRGLRAHRVHASSERKHLRAQFFDVLMLAEDYIAQLRGRALQVCDLGFEFFERFVVHGGEYKRPESTVEPTPVSARF